MVKGNTLFVLHWLQGVTPFSFLSNFPCDRKVAFSTFGSWEEKVFNRIGQRSIEQICSDVQLRRVLDSLALVHPEKREVFLLNTEPMVHQDGVLKNDCERNAAKRLQKNMKSDYAAYDKQYHFLFVEDALYANAPHVQDLESNGYAYILNVKPDSHKTLFAQVEGKRQRKQLKAYTLKQNGTIHHFEWANNLVLCNAQPNARVNFLHYQQTDKNGKTTTFTWITNISIDQNKVWAIMKTGRAPKTDTQKKNSNSNSPSAMYRYRSATDRLPSVRPLGGRVWTMETPHRAARQKIPG